MGHGGKRPGAGRPQGVPNKTTQLAKEAIALAAEGLGGHERLIAWAQEDSGNEKAFWTQIYPKLVPVQLSGDPDNPLEHKHKFDAERFTGRIAGLAARTAEDEGD